MCSHCILSVSSPPHLVSLGPVQLQFIFSHSHAVPRLEGSANGIVQDTYSSMLMKYCMLDYVSISFREYAIGLNDTI